MSIPMLGDGFVANARALGDQMRSRRRERRLTDAMIDMDTNPEGSIQRVRQVDPILGQELRTRYNDFNMRQQAQVREQTEHQQAQFRAGLHDVVGYLRSTAQDPNADLGAAFDGLAPVLTRGFGMSPDEIATARQAITSNPRMLENLEEQLTRVTSPGQSVVRIDPHSGATTETYRNPYPDTVMRVPRGDGGSDVVPIPRTYGGRPGATGPVAAPAPAGAPQGGAARTPAPAPAPGPVAAAGNGHSFRDPVYDQYEASAAQEFGVPQQLLASIRLRGERSNADQVSPAGAQTVYQVIPQTRAGLLRQYGVDAYASPQDAARAAAAHLRETYDRTGSWERAAVEYHGGPDDSRHGPRTRAYAQRVNGGGPGEPQVRSDGGRPSAGGPLYSTPGRPAAPQWRMLSPDEATNLGLDPAARWQQSPAGETRMIGPANQLSSTNRLRQQQAQVTIGSIRANTRRLEDAAQALLRHPGLDRAAGTMSYLPSIRGGNAANFEADLEALKSQIGFAILNEMRQTSRTGGALGNVSNFEVQTLQRNIAALDLTQSPAQLRSRINAIAQYARQLRARFENAYQQDSRTYGGQPAEGGGRQPTRGGSAAPPRAAQDLLRQDPSPARRRQFDQVFGQGAAARVLGR